MNKLEKLIYDAVKGSPALKFALRNLYQTAFDMLPTPGNQFHGKYSLAPDSFFGFHDKCPFSEDNSKILACRTSIPLRMPREEEALEVGYYDLTPEGEFGLFHKIDETLSWNYHKGCRLQWTDRDSVIFNVRKGNALASRVCSVDGLILREYPFPIDTVSDDGRKATSFSYERLNILMPGYGYEYCEDGGNLDTQRPDGTGLFVIDLVSGERTLLYSLDGLSKLSEGEDENLTGNHYVTHTEFSPNGRYISFLHRWIGSDYRKRHSQLIVHDSSDGSVRVMPATGMVSHYIWNTNDSIIAYCSVAEGDAHVLFNVTQNTYSRIMPDKLNADGHQSVIDDGVFVTDTYPDKRRMASILLVDMLNGRKDVIAKVYSPKAFQTKDFHNHIACDLHPRASHDGSFVSFDTAFTGKRSLCVMKLK